MSRTISVAHGASLGKGGFATNTSSIIGGEGTVIVQGAAGMTVNSGVQLTGQHQAGNSFWLTTNCALRRGNRSKSL